MSDRDLEEVAELASQLGYPCSREEVARRFADIANNPSYGLFVATSDTNEVLGWVQVNAEPEYLLVGARAEVAALVVDEKFRSQGIGKALLKRAETWARENGYSLIRLRSNLKRQDAHRFYQREGYTLSKTSNVFTKELPR